MPGILVFIPMFNCERQIPRVLASLVPFQKHIAEILVVDNRSADGSIEAAKAAMASLGETNVTLIQNNENYHFGGSHKVAFHYALEKGYTHVLILHGDDQADIRDIMALIEAGEHEKVDLLLGARFHPDSKLIGYSKFRTYGNVLVDIMATVVSGQMIYDTGAGLNVYSVASFDTADYRTLPNDLTFSACFLFACLRNGVTTRFFPLSWREEDQVSNAKVMRQGIAIVRMMLRYALRLPGFIARVEARPMPYEVVASK